LGTLERKISWKQRTDTGSALLKMIEVIWRRREGQKSSRSA
jgi:hypothetical protein